MTILGQTVAEGLNLLLELLDLLLQLVNAGLRAR